MSLKTGLESLKNITSSGKGRSVGASSQFQQVRRDAVVATAQWTVDTLIKPRMARPWPPSGGNSAGTDPPAVRTRSLMNAVKVFPGVSYGNTALIQVDPKATDTSEGGRLQLYSKYLESGWRLRPKIHGRKLSKGRPGGSRQRMTRQEKDDSVAVSGLRQPPRPYIKQIFIRNELGKIREHYRAELRKRLPVNSRHLAANAGLQITYIHPFQFRH